MTSGTPMLTRDADLHYPVLIMQGFQKKNSTNGIRQCNVKIITPLQLVGLGKMTKLKSAQWNSEMHGISYVYNSWCIVIIVIVPFTRCTMPADASVVRGDWWQVVLVPCLLWLFYDHGGNWEVFLIAMHSNITSAVDWQISCSHDFDVQLQTC
jgi:hypothetical protein